MTLRNDILFGQFLKLDVQARIDGQFAPDLVEASCSAGTDQINAEATLVYAQRPSWAEEQQSVELRGGYNNQNVQIHGGEVVGFEWSSFAPRVGVLCRDLLARTRYKWGGADRTYANIDDGALITDVLRAYGVPDALLQIESSGWILGTIERVVLAQGESGWSLIERIDRLSGYRTFSGTNGIIYRRRVSGATSETPAFRVGVNDVLGIRRRRDTTGIVNQVTVRGLSYEGVDVTGSASATNPYIPTPPGFIADELQDDLVETDVKATEIAQREVADRNRRPETLELEIVGNPLIQPGMTILVEHRDVESGQALVFVENIKHTISATTWTTTLRTSGGNLSGYNAAAPVVQIDLKLFLEAEDTGSGTAGVIVAVADGVGTFDPDGDETGLQYQWTIAADGGVPSVISQTGGTICRFTLPDTATSVRVTVAATDPDGLVGTATVTQPIDTRTMLVEDLSTAEGLLVAYSNDGQQTWQELTLPNGATSECLAPFAPEWGQLWGASNGHVYATLDAGVTLTDLGQPLANTTRITAVWVHELSTTRLWAANEGGGVAFGELNVDAKTVAWVKVGDIGAGPVIEIRESIDQFGALSASAAQGYYQSSDGGATWTRQDSGDTASRLADGFGRNFYSFRNDDRPLREKSGYGVMLPPDVRHVRGLSVGWRVAELYAADEQARLFRGDLGPDGVQLTQVDVAPTFINHAQRSGNEDGVVYLAGDAGLLKSLRLEQPWYVRRTNERRCFMVGYGSAHPRSRRLVPVQVEVLIAAAPGTSSGIWHYSPNHPGDGWILKNTGLPSGLRWSIGVSPYNPNHWLAQAYALRTDIPSWSVANNMVVVNGTQHSAIWLSTDNGMSWAPVAADAAGFSEVPRGFEVTWGRSQGELLACGEVRNGGGSIGNIWVGTASGLERRPLTSQGNQRQVVGVHAGRDGDVIAKIQVTTDDFARFAFMPNGQPPATILQPPDPVYNGLGSTLNLDGSRAVGGFSNTGPNASHGLYYTSDYRTQPPQFVTPGRGGIAWLADDSAYTINPDNGKQLLHVSSLAGAPTPTVAPTPALSDPTYDFAVVTHDAQQRRAVLARLSFGGDATSRPESVVFDGQAWKELPGPTGTGRGDLTFSCAIIVRGGSV